MEVEVKVLCLRGSQARGRGTSGGSTAIKLVFGLVLKEAEKTREKTERLAIVS